LFKATAVRKIDLNNFHVATNGMVRDINSRIMLNLVRKHQPVSRADLTRYSGLQRSTVSVITEQLLSKRWLKEGAVGDLPRGRKPTFLHLNAERCGAVGVAVQHDITMLGLATLDSQFIAQETIPTGKDPDEFISRVSRRIIDLMRSRPQMTYGGVGISLPGRVDISTGRLIFAPSLTWNNLDLRTPIEAATGLPVQLENAANACALAEAGSGKYTDHVNNLLAVVVSQGIGVGIILHGQLVRGAGGMAGEFGHVAQMLHGPRCRCGNEGCWEVLANNVAAVRYYTDEVTARNGQGSRRNAAQLSFNDILRLAEKGDIKASKALNRMAYHLGEGLAMLVAGLAPEFIVVVGEVTRAWTVVEPVINEVLKRRQLGGRCTRILPSDPETQPRLRGAVALVLQKYFSAPPVS
jgi:predicted NBD/HSP70 family sugar kinase